MYTAAPPTSDIMFETMDSEPLNGSDQRISFSSRAGVLPGESQEFGRTETNRTRMCQGLQTVVLKDKVSNVITTSTFYSATIPKRTAPSLVSFVNNPSSDEKNSSWLTCAAL